jgi:hypothetical protein
MQSCAHDPCARSSSRDRNVIDAREIFSARAMMRDVLHDHSTYRAAKNFRLTSMMRCVTHALFDLVF